MNAVTFSVAKHYLHVKHKTTVWPSNVTLILFQYLEDQRYSALCFETQYQLRMLFSSCQSSILTHCNSPARLISDYTNSVASNQTGLERSSLLTLLYNSSEKKESYPTPRTKKKKNQTTKDIFL